MMKKLFACLLVVALAIPASLVMAQDDSGVKIELSQLRNRLDYRIQSVELDDTLQEYFEDDVDVTVTVTSGDLTADLFFELADRTFATDYAEQSDALSYSGGYIFTWTPEGLADKEFALTAGELGNCFGKCVLYPVNEETDRGAINLSMKLGNMSTNFEYMRDIEGELNDDVEGDQHAFRTWISMPVGENFNLGAYAAFHSGSDLIETDVVEATEETPEIPAVMKDFSAFVGAVDFSMTTGKVELYGEGGFAAGTEDIDGTETDLSGFYALGGASMATGSMTLGLEAGFGSGDDDATDDEQTDWIGPATDFWLGVVMHDWEAVYAGGGLSNLMYGQVTADANPSDKLNLFGGLLYLKPVEEVGEIDTYGFEVFGYVNYDLSDHVLYSLQLGYAIVDENVADDNQYIVRNRMQFSF